jgi:hypothetical protein
MARTPNPPEANMSDIALQMDKARSQLSAVCNDSLAMIKDLESQLAAAIKERDELKQQLAKSEEDRAHWFKRFHDVQERPAWDVTHKWQSKTRGGHEVVHVFDFSSLGNCNDGYQIVSVIKVGDSVDSCCQTKSGFYDRDTEPHEFDLIHVAQTEQVEEYVPFSSTEEIPAVMWDGWLRHKASGDYLIITAVRSEQLHTIRNCGESLSLYFHEFKWCRHPGSPLKPFGKRKGE